MIESELVALGGHDNAAPRVTPRKRFVKRLTSVFAFRFVTVLGVSFGGG